MTNQTLTQLANQIVALRSAATFFSEAGSAPSPIPIPLTYKSGGNTGAMIALFLPTSVGAHFMQSDPGALPPSDLHVTLAYLGKADDLSRRQIKETHDLMRLISENHPPLTGHINGCGRFCNGDDDGDPFFIIPDLAALPNLRQVIIDGLGSHAIEGAKDHGFVPHITLTYLPHAEGNPFDIIEKTPITFGNISLVLGDDRYDYPLAQGVLTLSRKALIEKIGARHTGAERGTIQKMHDLTLDLGAECHPLTRRAGAKHSHTDRVMVQRMHDDCAGLGAECKALPERDPVYSSQTLKDGEIIKGSAGSGNFGHDGRPGRLGGSQGGGGLRRIGAKKDSKPGARKKAAKKFREKRSQGKTKQKLASMSTGELNLGFLNAKSHKERVVFAEALLKDFSDNTVAKSKKDIPKLKNRIQPGVREIADKGKNAIFKLPGGAMAVGKVLQGASDKFWNGNFGQIEEVTPVFKATLITKAQSDAPNYQPASTPQRCANCRFFLGDPGRDWCDLFDFTADPDYVSDAWEAQRPNEIPEYNGVSRKGDITRIEVISEGGSSPLELKNWENSTPAQRKARDAINNAIKAGTLKKASTKICFRCGKRRGAEYHHINGYHEGKKLQVRAICMKCHATITQKSDLAALTERVLALRSPTKLT